VADHARQLVEALPEELAVTWLALPEDGARRRWRALADQAGGLDLLHVHFETSLFHSVKPLRNRFATLMNAVAVPKVATLHGPLPALAPRWRRGARRPADLLRDLLYLPFFARWERTQYGRADRWIVHSEERARHVETHGGAGRTTVIALPTPAVERRWSPAGDGVARLVTPGFVKEAKGLELLLEAVAALPEVRWTIAGGPQDAADRRTLAAIEARIEALGLGDRVRITGFLPREEIDELLATASVAAFPYRWSTGSSALAWAIGSSTPILVSDLAVFRELVEGGAGLELVAEGDADAWITALRGLLGDPERRVELSRRNRAYAARSSWRHAAERTAAVYGSALGG